MVACVSACKQLAMTSDVFGSVVFETLSASQISTGQAGTTGRAAYRTAVSEEGVQLFLFHIIASPWESGSGRWVLDHSLGATDSAIAYVDSWAIMPNLVHAVNEPNKRFWNVFDGNDWVPEYSLQFQCIGHEDDSVDPDSTIFLDITGEHWFLSGFFVEIANSPDSGYLGPLYQRIQSPGDALLYLFQNEGKWIIGQSPGVADGIAFVNDLATVAKDIHNTEWYFSHNGDWRQGEGVVVFGDKSRNIYSNLRYRRSIKYVPAGHTTFELRNGLPMPALGFGTGGIPDEIQADVIRTALSTGFRTFDLAREYGNENVFGSVVNDPESLSNPEIPLRSEVFVVSKVWPTNFGFLVTEGELSATLRDLQSAYVDQYLLHWPECIAEWDWMHCDTTVDSRATWREAWRALERAYSEGRVMSIGVSNFNVQTLDELVEYATVVPHAIQNHAEVRSVDMEARIWASNHGAVFTPYAMMRNINSLPEDLLTDLNVIAEKHNVSPHAVVARFFAQSGTAIIPRSTNRAHMQEMLDIVTWQLDNSEMVHLGWIDESPRSDL